MSAAYVAVRGHGGLAAHQARAAVPMLVGGVPDASELDRVSELRRRQLDEMERRDPVGFRRWVGSGTWVTGDSAPFLRR